MNTGLYFSAAKVLTRWLICAGATLSLTLAILVASAADAATSVTVVGLFPGKAVVVINGQAPRTLSVGDKTAEGVTLLATTADTATVAIDGKRHQLDVGQHYAAPASARVVRMVALRVRRVRFLMAAVHPGRWSWPLDVFALRSGAVRCVAGRQGGSNNWKEMLIR